MRHNSEQFVAQGNSCVLCSEFSEFFAPMYFTVQAHRRYKGVKKVIKRFAFPGYVFVKPHFDSVDWRNVFSESRVIGVVRDFDGNPAITDAEIIEVVSTMERQNFGISPPDSSFVPEVGYVFRYDLHGHSFDMKVVGVHRSTVTCVPVISDNRRGFSLKIPHTELVSLSEAA